MSITIIGDRFGLRAVYGVPENEEDVAWRESHLSDLRAARDLWAFVEERPVTLPEGEGLEISLYAVSQGAFDAYLASDRTEVRRQAKAHGLTNATMFGPMRQDVVDGGSFEAREARAGNEEMTGSIPFDQQVSAGC